MVTLWSVLFQYISFVDGHPTAPALFTVKQDLGGSATEKCEKFGESNPSKSVIGPWEEMII